MGFLLNELLATRIQFIRKFQTRLASKHFIKGEKEIKEQVEKELPRIVKEQHDIELNEKRQKDLLNQRAKKTPKQTEHLFVDIAIDETHSLKALAKAESVYKKLIEDDEKILKDLKDKELIEKFNSLKTLLQKLLLAGLEDVEDEFRKEYKDVLNLIAELEKDGKSETVMAKFKEFFKSDGDSYFAYRAVRSELKDFYKGENRLEMDEKFEKQNLEKLHKDLENLLEDLKKHPDKVQEDKEKVLKRIEDVNGISKKLVKHLRETYKEAFLGLKRILLVELGLVVAIKDWLGNNSEWIKDNLVPQKTTEEINDILKGIMKELDADIREFAQALRRLVSQDGKIKADVKHM